MRVRVLSVQELAARLDDRFAALYQSDDARVQTALGECLPLSRDLGHDGAIADGLVIAAGEGGKSKTALQMIGILALIIGYPYRLSVFGVVDLGVVDLVSVGRWLVYVSLFFSITSAFQYVGLFAEAVEANEQRRKVAEP